MQHGNALSEIKTNPVIMILKINFKLGEEAHYDTVHAIFDETIVSSVI